MTDTTFAGIANILAAMPAAQPWSDTMAAVYALAMKDWDDMVAQRAAMQALMTRKWRPSPAELREFAMQVKKIKVPNPTVREQIRHIVVHHPANERRTATEKLVQQGKVSPMVNEVVDRMGGWNTVGMMSEEQLSTSIDREMQECLESETVEKMLSTPLPALASANVKMIG